MRTTFRKICLGARAVAMGMFLYSLQPAVKADPAATTLYQFNGSAATAVSSGTTITLSRLGGISSCNLTLASGTGSYAANVALSDTGIHAGDIYLVAVSYPASANPTLNIFDSGTTGTLLSSSTGTSIAGNTTLEFCNVTGTSWVHFPKGALLTKDLGAGVRSALGAASNTAGGFVTGSGTCGTAAQLGQRIVIASSIPGFHADYVPNTSGTDNGTDNAAALNAVIESGTVRVIFDNNWQASTIFPGNHVTLENLPGVIFHHKACNGYGICNFHPTAVNISGSAGTGTSSAAAGYGNSDVTIEGGIWDFNAPNETVMSSMSTRALPSNYGSFNVPAGHPDDSVHFSGVDGFQIGAPDKPTIFARTTGFSVYIGNSRHGLIDNLSITDKNLNFPYAIPGLTGSAGSGGGDGIHIAGSVHDVTIRDNSRLYGSDPISLEIGPGDMQEINPGATSLAGIYYGPCDLSILPWENSGATYDIKVIRFRNNGGDIGLFGETYGTVSGTAAAYSGTNSYAVGQVYHPVIQSPVHDITLQQIRFDGVDGAESSYPSLQTFSQINESFSDFPPSGYPAQCYNIWIDGVYMDPATPVPQQIDITGSNWTLTHLNVPLLDAPTSTPEFGVARIIQIGGNIVSGITIDDVQVGGTSNALYPTCVVQAGPGTNRLLVSNVSQSGVTYCATAVVGPSDIGGAGNSLNGLTSLTAGVDGGSFSTTYGQFSTSSTGGTLTSGTLINPIISGGVIPCTSGTATLLKSGSAMETIAGTNMIIAAFTSGTAYGATIWTGSGATSIAAFPGVGQFNTVSIMGDAGDDITIGQLGGYGAFGNYSIAIGTQANAWGGNAIAIGQSASTFPGSTGGLGIAIGANSAAPGNRATALGAGASAMFSASGAFGWNATATGTNEITIGGNGAGSMQAVNVPGVLTVSGSINGALAVSGTGALVSGSALITNSAFTPNSIVSAVETGTNITNAGALKVLCTTGSMTVISTVPSGADTSTFSWALLKP